MGQAVSAMAVVRGGDVAAAYRVELADGSRVFAKTHPHPPANFFTTEANGLSWLREAGTLPVPEVLHVADGDEREPAMLVLEWIDEGRQGVDGDDAFGDALARLHAAGAPSFGREDRRTTGSRGLPNEPQPSWSAFYASNRLLPLARLARDGGALSPATIERLERLAVGLDRFDDGEPPSRLHGDLWGGNRLIDRAGRSWLIDPAAHGGHREYDLAMMRLFGGFGAGAFARLPRAVPVGGGLGGADRTAPDRSVGRPCDQVRRGLRRCSNGGDRPVLTPTVTSGRSVGPSKR